jgi:hypothetical protein
MGDTEKGRIITFSDGKPRIVEFGDPVLAAARIQDPILTTQSQGFRNTDLIGDLFFPMVPTEKETGRFPAWGKEAWKLHFTKRSLRGEVAHMEAVQGYIKLEEDEHSLGFELDDREADEYAVGRESMMFTRQTMVDDALALEREINRAIALTTYGNYNAGNYQSGSGFAWNASGDPITHFQAGREAIRAKIGKYPNVAAFDPTAWNKFRNNAAVRDRIKYSGSFAERAMVSLAAAAELLEVDQVVVGKAVYTGTIFPGAGETAAVTGDVWGAVQAGNAILAYRALGIMTPGFGMGAAKKGYPKTTSYRWERTKSWVYETEQIYADVVTLKDAAYLMYGIV